MDKTNVPYMYLQPFIAWGVVKITKQTQISTDIGFYCKFYWNLDYSIVNMVANVVIYVKIKWWNKNFSKGVFLKNVNTNLFQKDYKILGWQLINELSAF